jgi:hypothetical protein
VSLLLDVERAHEWGAGMIGWLTVASSANRTVFLVSRSSVRLICIGFSNGGGSTECPSESGVPSSEPHAVESTAP